MGGVLSKSVPRLWNHFTLKRESPLVAASVKKGPFSLNIRVKELRYHCAKRPTAEKLSECRPETSFRCGWVRSAAAGYGSQGAAAKKLAERPRSPRPSNDGLCRPRSAQGEEREIIGRRGDLRAAAANMSVHQDSAAQGANSRPPARGPGTGIRAFWYVYLLLT